MSDQTLTVAITMRRSDATDYVEPRDAISHDWIAFLEAHRIRPVLIPTTVRDPVGFVVAIGAQALILSNGENVDGGPRDQTEAALLTHALSSALPVIGVCRGLQFVQTYFGGPLRSGLRASGHVATVHEIALDGLLRDQTGLSTCEVNSYHDQGVHLSELAAPLHPLATCGEVVEAAGHDASPLLAVQWHPERKGSCAALDQYIFGPWLRERVQ